MEEAIRGCSVLVVGASAGIGRESAAAFARAGANVMAVGRRADKLRELADEVELKWCAADITSPGEPQRLVSETVDAFGGIDILLNVAAASPMVAVADVAAEEFLNVFASNVVAPSEVCKAAFPHLNENAFIGFVSSETVGRPRHGMVPYGASKAALEELVNGWRVENPNIRFSTIRVGATIGTDFGRDFDGELIGKYLEEWIRGGHLSAEMMTPEAVGVEMAELVAVAYLHPTVNLSDFSLRPPGPLATLG
jgi:NAD(P)-dependent dehydrogenase (short-subunit alcohol dehydrogenase family)